MTSPFRFESRFDHAGRRAVAGGAALPRRGSVGAGVTPFDFPARERSAVLGKATMLVSQLLRVGRGAVIELDRKGVESILVNDRLVRRGEVVILDDRLGVTMTEDQRVRAVTARRTNQG